MFEYFVMLALGIIGIYLFRDGMLDRQRRKDAEQERSEKERIG